MPNVDRPDGFRPVRYLSGAPWNGAYEVYCIPAAETSPVFTGDLVELVGTSTTVNDKSYANVEQADTSSETNCAGVVVGFEPIPTDLNLPAAAYRATGAQAADRLVYVVTDPNVLFEVQSDGIGIALADVGLNVSALATAAGSVTTGRSAMEIDSGTEATTATLQFRIIEHVARMDNLVGDAATTGSRWLVKFISLHQYLPITGQVGI